MNNMFLVVDVVFTLSNSNNHFSCHFCLYIYNSLLHSLVFTLPYRLTGNFSSHHQYSYQLSLWLFQVGSQLLYSTAISIPAVIVAVLCGQSTALLDSYIHTSCHCGCFRCTANCSTRQLYPYQLSLWLSLGVQSTAVLDSYTYSSFHCCCLQVYSQLLYSTAIPIPAVIVAVFRCRVNCSTRQLYPYQLPLLLSLGVQSTALLDSYTYTSCHCCCLQVYSQLLYSTAIPIPAFIVAVFYIFFSYFYLYAEVILLQCFSN